MTPATICDQNAHRYVQNQIKRGNVKHMKRLIVIVLLGILLLSACDTATGITVKSAWARPAAQGGNGAVYFLLQNHSAGPDELIAVSSDIAEAAEIHETKMDGDVMKMEPVMSVPVKEKESIEFAPGGLHVMLIGLQQELKAGDQFEITLQFAGQGNLTLTVPVQETGENDSTSNH
jgi:periplasmic copper chaperone A